MGSQNAIVVVSKAISTYFTNKHNGIKHVHVNSALGHRLEMDFKINQLIR